MIDNKRVLGLILARAGSKGLPGKNTRTFCGKPLIAWSIKAGLLSELVDNVIVSTDGEEIAAVSLEYGAEVPFFRPPSLASDSSPSIDAVLHAIEWLENNGRYFDIVTLLEPTSPLRQSTDIDTALRLMINHCATSVVSVVEATAVHPSFMFQIDEHRRLSPITGIQPNGLRRQEIEPVFYLDGTIYCAKTPTLKQKKSFYHDDSLSYIVPKWKSLEIDDEDDFIMAEAIMRARLSHK